MNSQNMEPQGYHVLSPPKPSPTGCILQVSNARKGIRPPAGPRNDCGVRDWKPQKHVSRARPMGPLLTSSCNPELFQGLEAGSCRTSFCIAGAGLRLKHAAQEWLCGLGVRPHASLGTPHHPHPGHGAPWVARDSRGGQSWQ